MTRFDPGLPDDRVNVSGTNPLFEAGLLVGGLLAVVLAVAVGSSLAMEWIVPRLPTGLEVRVFGGGWIPGIDGAEEDEEASEPDPREAEVQALVDRLATHWPDNPYAFKVTVWDNEVPNAFALPGGWIGVTSGLLESVESENELAFVLGHEIGHFRNRDHLKGLGRGLALGIVLSAVGLTGVGGVGDLAGIAGGLAQRSFDREQESDADRFGLEVVATEYGHVGGAPEFFRRVPDEEELWGNELTEYLSTHPLSEERIQAMRDLAAERSWPSEGQLVALSPVVTTPPADEEEAAAEEAEEP